MKPGDRIKVTQTRDNSALEYHGREGTLDDDFFDAGAKEWSWWVLMDYPYNDGEPRQFFPDEFVVLNKVGHDF